MTAIANAFLAAPVCRMRAVATLRGARDQFLSACGRPVQGLGGNNFASGERQRSRNLPPIPCPLPRNHLAFYATETTANIGEPVGTQSTARSPDSADWAPRAVIRLKTRQVWQRAARLTHAALQLSHPVTNSAASLLLGEIYTHKNY